MGIDLAGERFETGLHEQALLLFQLDFVAAVVPYLKGRVMQKQVEALAAKRRGKGSWARAIVNKPGLKTVPSPSRKNSAASIPTRNNT